MGYNLTIGQLEVHFNTNDGRESTVYMEAKKEGGRTEGFLNVGDPIDSTNSRWPSYTGWAAFTEESDLVEFFYNVDYGLLREHPGVFPLVEEHRTIVNEKYEKFKKENPNSLPNYDDEGNQVNGTMVRLEWLKYWINWALDNCDKPVFENS